MCLLLAQGGSQADKIYGCANMVKPADNERVGFSQSTAPPNKAESALFSGPAITLSHPAFRSRLINSFPAPKGKYPTVIRVFNSPCSKNRSAPFLTRANSIRKNLELSSIR